MASRPHFKDNHSPVTAGLAQLTGHCALLAPSAAGHRRDAPAHLVPSPNKPSVESEACKEPRTEASLLKPADASVFV